MLSDIVIRWAHLGSIFCPEVHNIESIMPPYRLSLLARDFLGLCHSACGGGTEWSGDQEAEAESLKNFRRADFCVQKFPDNKKVLKF